MLCNEGVRKIHEFTPLAVLSDCYGRLVIGNFEFSLKRTFKEGFCIIINFLTW